MRKEQRFGTVLLQGLHVRGSASSNAEAVEGGRRPMGARGRLQSKPRFAICLVPCKLSRYEGVAIILLNDERICMAIFVSLSQVPFLASSFFPVTRVSCFRITTAGIALVDVRVESSSITAFSYVESLHEGMLML
jgi:hypothetical protein